MNYGPVFRRSANYAMASHPSSAVEAPRVPGTRRGLTPASRSIGAPEPLGRLDVLWVAIAVALTFAASYVLGHGRIPWEDELLGWMLIQDPSWRHMVHAWQVGADGGGFTFYLTARAWCAVFGHSVTALRFYSAAGFAAAFCLLWVTARRFYSLWTVAIALFAFWFLNPVIVTHMAEARFYGLLMLGSTLAVWLLAKASAIRGAPAWLCLSTFLAHAMLSTSHMLGLVYSANLLAALFLLDWWNNNRRWPLYLSGAAAWLLLIPERTALAASAAVGKPHFWIRPPNLRDFLFAYTSYSGVIAGLGGIVLLLALWSLVRQGKPGRAALASSALARKAVYVTAVVLFLVPLEMLVEGRVGPPLLLGRYLLPLAIAQVLAAAEGISLIARDSIFSRSVPKRGAFEAAFVAAFALVLFIRDFRNLPPHAIPPADYTREITDRLPHGIPVLCEDALMFAELIGQQHASGVNYMYMLDWPQSISAEAPRPEVTQYHLMENWKKAGYFSNSIEQREPFLKQYPKFLVLIAGYGLAQPFSPEASRNPLVERFAHNPAYQVLPYGKKGSLGVQDTWLVCRGGC